MNKILDDLAAYFKYCSPKNLKIAYSHFVREFRGGDEKLMGKSTDEMRTFLTDEIKTLSPAQLKELKQDLDGSLEESYKQKVARTKHFVGTKKLKHVKLFEAHVNETKEADFIMDNAKDLKDAVKALKDASVKLNQLWKSVDEDEVGKMMDTADNAIENYESNIPRSIQLWINTDVFRAGVSDIVDLAIENERKYGTEPHFVIEAIITWCRVFMREAEKNAK